MTEKDERQLTKAWTDSFIKMAKRGGDPAEIADAMLTTASLLVAQHRGDQAAILQMLAGLSFLTRRETSTPEPSRGGLN
jgi:hypothetical protein